MYHLYYTMESAAMGCHAALEEIGAEFVLHHVNVSRKRTRDYLTLNPLGKVPSLVDERDDGERLVLYQSGAILLYLADRHPEAKLAPAPGSAERGQCYQWLSFMGEMLQASYMMSCYPERFTTDTEGREAVVARGAKWVMEYLSLVESALIPGPYFLGETFSVCDLFLHTMSRWNPPDYPRFADFPSLARNAALVEARPAVRRMLEVQGEAA
jgi:glutathione S-transferase